MTLMHQDGDKSNCLQTFTNLPERDCSQSECNVPLGDLVNECGHPEFDYVAHSASDWPVSPHRHWIEKKLNAITGQPPIFGSYKEVSVLILF